MTSERKKLCVYCSSRQAVVERYGPLADELAEFLAREKMELVFGGSFVGLMKSIASACSERGVRVTGVIPKFMAERGIGFLDADELIVSGDMRERKAAMERLADAFLAFPGGVGTLDEFAEILSLKSLDQNRKPLVLLDPDGFYEPLVRFFEAMVEREFAKPNLRRLYYRAQSIDDMAEYLHSFVAEEAEPKW